VFNAKVDNTTTAFDGTGNIIVKASAQLTTPNIGAATGTSVSVTANVTGGNVLTGGIISSTGTITGGNLQTGGLITATGNITAVANIAGGNILTAGIVSSTGNAIHGNIATAGLITATGNITAVANIAGGNILTAGIVSSTGNATAGNISTAGLISAAGNAIVAGHVYVGPGATNTTFTNPIIVGRDTGNTYVQLALINAAGNGSADLITYANNGDDSQAWADVGFTGNTFNDPNYTVTGPNDGYFFVQGNASFGGNMVIATGATGTTKDIIFATGGFQSSNIKARLFNATGAFSVTGNILGGNINTAGLISSSGNVVSGNINTAGLITATGNIISAGNISGGNILATTAMYVGGVSVLTVNSTVDGGTY
jgi:hypothetical protein